ncbi:MAG TPA: peptide chain release factor N(5)-glutamine methyltransferase [Methylocella sp.]|nr:peptide chain release factor N(5)-glutamine methyltransferase [Methylocella sp.]
MLQASPAPDKDALEECELRFLPGMERGAAQRALAALFREHGIESANADARVLLCASLGAEYADVVRNPDRPLGRAAAALAAFAARRLKREPVSRIIGEREFWTARYAISSDVLDPRPATETLIEAVLDFAARQPRQNWRILDLGTGSGAILCSLLQSLPGSSGVGSDKSPAACRVAQRNLAALGLAGRGHIVCGDWTQALRGPFDVIVSNPPYIPRADIRQLAPDVRNFDPRLALDGGDDGLDAYRAIIPSLPELLAPGGIVALEIGSSQKREVELLLRGAFNAPAEARLDLDGNWRVMTVSPLLSGRE